LLFNGIGSLDHPFSMVGLTAARPIEHNFATLATGHGFETALKIGGSKAVRDHFADIEPALEHCEHFVPCLEHFTAIDAFDGQNFENHF
jgi:hypothetical protein